MAKKTKAVPVFMLGDPILDMCPCGKNVSRSARQELVWWSRVKAWARMCGLCLDDGRTMDDYCD